MKDKQISDADDGGGEQLLQDQPSKSSSLVVVVSGQKASLTCPLLSTSSAKLHTSSAASASGNPVLVKWHKGQFWFPPMAIVKPLPSRKSFRAIFFNQIKLH